MISDLVMVDTSVWIEALRTGGAPACRQLVDALIADGRIATCEVVIVEILQGGRSQQHVRRLTADLLATSVLSMHGAGEVAGRLAWTLRTRGLTMPTADLLIAATAHLHNAALLHRDRHLAEAAEALGLPVIEP